MRPVPRERTTERERERAYSHKIGHFCAQGNETLRVLVPNNHILTQNLYYNYYYPNPKYLIIGYMDPLGSRFRFRA